HAGHPDAVAGERDRGGAGLNGNLARAVGFGQCLASSIRRSTVSGASRESTTLAPRWARASSTALAMAAGAPIVPLSATPLKPPGTWGAGVSRWYSSGVGKSVAVGTR